MDEHNSAAEELAEVLDGFAQAVRTYLRAHWDELSTNERDDLKAHIDHFEDLHERFAADAIQETLAGLESQIQDLRVKTVSAQQALKTLTRIEDATKIISAVLGAAESAVCGDVGGTADKLADLAVALIPTDGTATAHG
jgi:chromosome segregation ATPase